MGGGALFVPALTLGLGLSQLDAEATSLLAIIPVALVGARAPALARQRRRPDRRGARRAWPSAAPSAGAAIANAVPQRALEVGFGLFLLFVAWRLAWRSRSAAEAEAGRS